MQKKLFKIVSTFIIITCLFCGCGVNDNEAIAHKGKVSEYGELDMPWGECNYKKAGVIKELEKDIDENITTAVLTVDGKDNKVKIYGTNMNTDDYDGKDVFISAVQNNHVDEEYILVKRYQDINLDDLDLIDSIKNLSSLDNKADLDKLITKIESLENKDYRSYIVGIYNAKIKELSPIKEEQDKVKKSIEDSKALWKEYKDEE